MRNIIAICGLILLVTQLVQSQNTELFKDRFIEMNGRAEIVIQPDQIELLVTLSENKSQSLEAEISWIDSKFKEAIRMSNISQIEVFSLHYWRNGKKSL